jgi:glutamate carboxypeptidase
MDEPAISALAQQLRHGAEQQRAELVETVRSLGTVDAPSGTGADALRDAADALVALLSDLDGRLTRTPGPQGELIEIEFSRDRMGAPVLILAHYDTVWPAGTAERRPISVDAETIRGPGVFDMRGGIAAATGALRLLGLQRLARPTVLLATPDEETGSATSAARIVELGSKASCVLVLEPPLAGGGVKTARAGWSTYRLTVVGRAAHAGLEPDRGVSAIDELCDVLITVRGLAVPQHGTTINAGVVSGGTAANTVAAQATALIDVRARHAPEQQRVDRALCALAPVRHDARLRVERLTARPPLERTPAIAAAYAHARAISVLLGADLQEGAVGGASDANLLADHRVALLDGLGPDGGGAHAEHEHISINSLVQRTALIAMLLAFPPGTGERLP